ncbi:MAG: hypothetical protein Q9202_000940 [Teloschistes flavicans]
MPSSHSSDFLNLGQLATTGTSHRDDDTISDGISRQVGHVTTSPYVLDHISANVSIHPVTRSSWMPTVDKGDKGSIIPKEGQSGIAIVKG